AKTRNTSSTKACPTLSTPVKSKTTSRKRSRPCTRRLPSERDTKLVPYSKSLISVFVLVNSKSSVYSANRSWSRLSESFAISKETRVPERGGATPTATSLRKLSTE